MPEIGAQQRGRHICNHRRYGIRWRPKIHGRPIYAVNSAVYRVDNRAIAAAWFYPFTDWQPRNLVQQSVNTPMRGRVKVDAAAIFPYSPAHIDARY